MFKKIFSTLISIHIICVHIYAQQKQNNYSPKPKLIIGIVVDQMRWDFLYRYADRYKNDGGFKRLLTQGFSCNNTMIPYTPTITACGHTCIYTGSVPAIHGITGNNWWDNQSQKNMYCTEDKTVQSVGSQNNNGEMSPRNMLVTTITYELRLATNFKSKVIGIALKDRGAILPAGHSANAAYWYDGKTGNFITSTYYMQALPNWVNQFNQKKLVNQYYTQGWKTQYPIETYTQSTTDEKAYESKPFGNNQTKFPYNFSDFVGKDYSKILITPHGNTLTFNMAEAAIEGEQLGTTNNITDFLAISFSSTDYVGHNFGPNAIETEDTYLRFDTELGDFMNYLDKKYGKNNYVLFLTADHGVALVPGFMQEHALPAGTMDDNALTKELNEKLKEQFKVDGLIKGVYNYQVILNHTSIDAAHIDHEKIIQYVIQHITTKPYIARAFDLNKLSTTTLPEKLRNSFANGYYPSRSGDIQFILKPGYIDGGQTGTTHGLWNPYDAHIPLLWYGWNIKSGNSSEEVYMTDIAPTLAALLHIQMPNGSIGKPIKAVLE